MNAPGLVSIAALTIALAGGWIHHRQRATMQELRSQLSRASEPRSASPTAPVKTAKPAARPTFDTLTPEEKRELFRLRGEVTLLSRRKQELMPLQADHDRLKAQLASNASSTNAPASGVPSSYIRRADVRFVGAATPEAALQSFFWAIENRDTNALANLMTKAGAESMLRSLAEKGPEGFWKEADMIPGYRLVEAKPESADVVRLRVEFLANDMGTDWKAHRDGDRWRLGD